MHNILTISRNSVAYWALKIDIDFLKKSTEKEAAKLLLSVNSEFTGQYLVTMIKLFKSVNLFKLFEFEIKCYAF